MTEKTSKIRDWSELLKSISRVLWVLVVIVLLAGLGKMFIFKNSKEGAKSLQPVDKQVVEKVDWKKVNKEVATIMEEARKQAEKEAGAELDKWIAENMLRVDEHFLDWYFGYWTQQSLGLQALLSEVMHWVDDDSPSAAEKVTQVVQEEFSNRVIRPVIAQARLERIIDMTMSNYAATLQAKINKIPGKYQIKPAAWDRYIADISTLVGDVEANRQVSLSLKTIVGVAAGGTFIATKVFGPIIMKIAGKISTRLAAKQAAGMAAKTGGKVAARAGGKFVGTLIAIGIIIWDVWDHYNTKNKALPVLRENIRDYFQELKQSILYDPGYGVITIIYGLEKSMVKDYQ